MGLHQSQKRSDQIRAARFLKHKDKLKEMTEVSKRKRDEGQTALEEKKNRLDQAKKDLLSTVEEEEKQTKAMITELEQEHNTKMEAKVEMLEKERMALERIQQEIEAET